MINFKELRAVDCTANIEKKGKFSYLSWPWAVRELRERVPDATWSYVTYSRDGSEYDYYMAPDGTCMVHVALHIEGRQYDMQLPVLDHRNKPIKEANAFDINTAQMRCLVKCIAVATGIGLHLYAGEDLPPVGQEKQNKFIEKAEISAGLAESTTSLAERMAELKKEAIALDVADELTLIYNTRLQQLIAAEALEA